MARREAIPHFDCGHVDEIELRAIGDLHIGDSACDYEMIFELVRWVKAKPTRYIVIAGDLFNAALRDSVSDVYSDVMTVDMAMEKFAEIFKPIADRVVAVVEGNHDRRVWKVAGVDPAKWACAKCGIPYYEAEALVCIKLGHHASQRGNTKRAPIHYLMYMTHGVGGGRLRGGKINSLARLGDIVTADLYIQGHTHTPMCFPDVVRSHDSQYRSVVYRRRMFVATGSCLDRAGYAKAFAFPALPKEWVVMALDGTKKWIEARI
jgi:UDP-2,3-diacylglucosamine pyrophosphatase LpxH